MQAHELEDGVDEGIGIILSATGFAAVVRCFDLNTVDGSFVEITAPHLCVVSAREILEETGTCHSNKRVRVRERKNE